MIIAFICLIFCILTGVGVFHYTYAMAADRNRQGMRLLVTIPAEVDKDGDVQQIIQMYRRDLKSLTLKLLLVGGAPQRRFPLAETVRLCYIIYAAGLCLLFSADGFIRKSAAALPAKAAAAKGRTGLELSGGDRAGSLRGFDDQPTEKQKNAVEYPVCFAGVGECCNFLGFSAGKAGKYAAGSLGC